MVVALEMPRTERTVASVVPCDPCTSQGVHWFAVTGLKQHLLPIIAILLFFGANSRNLVTSAPAES
jgi:hypothetical protein